MNWLPNGINFALKLQTSSLQAIGEESPGCTEYHTGWKARAIAWKCKRQKVPQKTNRWNDLSSQ